MLKKMQDIDASDFVSFHNAIEELGARRIYRGVSDGKRHKLIPGVGRIVFDKSRKQGLRSYERSLLRGFRERAYPFLTLSPRSDWEWLALAQHHGLPTRLLDWTYNPLVALYFAVQSQSDADAAIYAYKAPDKTLHSKSSGNPFEIEVVRKYRPRHFADRVRSQQGLFTVHPNPREPFENDDRIVRITIRAASKAVISDKLRHYGVSRASLFPGLDSIAHDLRG